MYMKKNGLRQRIVQIKMKFNLEYLFQIVHNQKVECST